MSHRILVIDHHHQAIQRVVDPLRDAGYEVVVAQTAADGASAFGRFEPELVFIAARLPRTHGTVLCRELKRTDAGSRTPIVLIVESTSIQIDLPPLDQFGADRLIQKPVGTDELLALCKELVGAAEPVTDPSQDPSNDADEGLTSALEELDSLEFDSPENTDGVSPGVVPLSDDRGKDIEDHIDDLFAGKTSPEPSTGQDDDADAAVIEDHDITENPLATPEEETTATVSTQGSTAPRPAPPTPSATATVRQPVSASGQTVGRFQTEALTRKRTMAQPLLPDTGSQAVLGRKTKSRIALIAIPAFLGLIALVAFFTTRNPGNPPTEPDTADKPSVADTVNARVEFALPAVPFEEASPVSTELEVADDLFTVESPPPVEPEKSPVVKKKPIRKPTPPVVEPEPVTRRETVAAPPPVAKPEPMPEPIETPVEETTQPETAFEPEPVVLEPVIPEPVELEPVIPEPVELEPVIPEPVELEPVIPEPVELEPVMPESVEPEPVVPDPVTRDPILVHRVEPRVSEKDLKKAAGTVVLRVRVSSSGRVTRVLVDQGLPGSPLEAAAVAAVLSWRYDPALDRDEPVEAWTTARFDFGD